MNPCTKCKKKQGCTKSCFAKLDYLRHLKKRREKNNA